MILIISNALRNGFSQDINCTQSFPFHRIFSHISTICHHAILSFLFSQDEKKKTQTVRPKYFQFILCCSAETFFIYDKLHLFWVKYKSSLVEFYKKFLCKIEVVFRIIYEKISLEKVDL